MSTTMSAGLKAILKKRRIGLVESDKLIVVVLWYAQCIVARVAVVSTLKDIVDERYRLLLAAHNKIGPKIVRHAY